MLPRPDPQSLTRFLVSIGAFLCIAAFIGPGLVLRETDVLRISAKELSTLTPTSRNELERRQAVARTVGEAAPYVGVAMLVGGIALLLFAAPRLGRQERTDEARSTAELDKLRAELKPQSEQEREARLQTEAVAEEAAPSTSAPGRRTGHDSVTDLHEATRGWVESARDIEQQVLAQIASQAAPRYRLSSNVRVEGATPLLLDGVLVSSVDQLRDVLVEVKASRGTTVSNVLGMQIDAAMSRLARYRSRVQRDALLWLIIVTEVPPSLKTRERLDRYARDFPGELAVSLISKDEIRALRIPS